MRSLSDGWRAPERLYHRHVAIIAISRLAQRGGLVSGDERFLLRLQQSYQLEKVIVRSSKGILKRLI
jgi:hypothetical protein